MSLRTGAAQGIRLQGPVPGYRAAPGEQPRGRAASPATQQLSLDANQPHSPIKTNDGSEQSNEPEHTPGTKRALSRPHSRASTRWQPIQLPSQGGPVPALHSARLCRPLPAAILTPGTPRPSLPPVPAAGPAGPQRSYGGSDRRGRSSLSRTQGSNKGARIGRGEPPPAQSRRPAPFPNMAPPGSVYRSQAGGLGARVTSPRARFHGNRRRGRREYRGPGPPGATPDPPRDLSGPGMFTDRTAPGADVQSLWRSARSARCEAVRDPRGGLAPALVSRGRTGGGCQGCALPGPSRTVPRLAPSLLVRDLAAGPAVPARPGTEPSRSGSGWHRAGPGRRGLCLPAGSVPSAFCWYSPGVRIGKERAERLPPRSWELLMLRCHRVRFSLLTLELAALLPSPGIPIPCFRALPESGIRASLPPITLSEGHKRITNTLGRCGATLWLTMNQSCAEGLECLRETAGRGRCFECVVQRLFFCLDYRLSVFFY